MQKCVKTACSAQLAASRLLHSTSSSGLSEAHTQFQRTVREFAQEELRPRADDRDRECEFPWPQVHQMGQLGLMGIEVGNH